MRFRVVYLLIDNWLGFNMSKSGILIAVEGMDGSGKSTQAKLLYHWLRAKGLPVYHTEWNSSKIVKAATKLGKQNKRLLPMTFHLIHAADFADRWAKQIEPVLKIGGIVICDRYKYTAMARDGSRDVSLETIEQTLTGDMSLGNIMECKIDKYAGDLLSDILRHILLDLKHQLYLDYYHLLHMKLQEMD